MKVLLTKHVPGKGRAGDIIDVSPGYAQNFLYKQGLAQAATKSAIDAVRAKAQKVKKEKARAISDAEGYANKLRGKTFTIQAKTNEDGHLYAAVHEKDIVQAIKTALSIDIAPSTIVISKEIKQVGTHGVQFTHKSGAVSEFKVRVDAV